MYNIYTDYCKPLFRTAPHFLTLDVIVPNTINTHKFHPSIIPGSKFKIPSQYFTDHFWPYKKFLSTFIYFTHCSACTAVPTVSFKNPPKLIIVALAQAP